MHKTKKLTALGFTRAHNCEKFTAKEKAIPQRKAIKDYCVDHKIDLIKIIAYDTNDFLQQDDWLDDLTKEIETKEYKIDMLVFYSWDRITRNDCSDKFRVFLNYCKSKNIDLCQSISN
jgi:DNA invertase Pin-like site-specific DNA recombinase